MKLGLSLPPGCDREYLGVDAATAWRRTVEVAQWAEDRGFESLWINDHMQVDPPVEEAIIFEPFAELAALAVETRRARIGHLVLSAAYRNPGLTAKAISTIDVISGGRAILGIGAGWKEDEWLAYGYGFPEAPERLAILADQLEIISRMLDPGRATWEGIHASVHDAIHEPKGLQQPRIPILVGGNGPKVTWRLAARFADELNLDAMTPERVEAALPIIRERCAEVGRAPETLKMSVFIWGEAANVRPGPERRQRFRDYAGLGLDLAIVQGFALVKDPHVIDDVIDDAIACGLLAAPVSPR
jgi:alkanesulfonate monooxygenase SsuD/methylene tetrahydromethanopterin reductase-like flavin-dependent oxidoreductase (luciferase family)